MVFGECSAGVPHFYPTFTPLLPHAYTGGERIAARRALAILPVRTLARAHGSRTHRRGSSPRPPVLKTVHCRLHLRLRLPRTWNSAPQLRDPTIACNRWYINPPPRSPLTESTDWPQSVASHPTVTHSRAPPPFRQHRELPLPPTSLIARAISGWPTIATAIGGLPTVTDVTGGSSTIACNR